MPLQYTLSKSDILRHNCLHTRRIGQNFWTRKAGPQTLLLVVLLVLPVVVVISSVKIPEDFLQEAQLPLRNRASAMHFFVAKSLHIAVITYNCV